jgi:hypothetical protein
MSLLWDHNLSVICHSAAKSLSSHDLTEVSVSVACPNVHFGLAIRLRWHAFLLLRCKQDRSQETSSQQGVSALQSLLFTLERGWLSSCVGFEVITAVTMKNAVFWDVAPCRFNIKRRFGGNYRLHLQGSNNAREGSIRRIALLTVSNLITLSSLALFALHWRWRRHVPPKRRFMSNPHDATSQKTEFFMIQQLSLQFIAVKIIFYFSNIWHRVDWCILTDISEKCTASTFNSE